MKTLTIIQEDHPGLLTEITTVLEKQGIDLIDLSAQSVGNTAVISITVHPYRDTFRLLSDAGYRVVASEHLLVRIEKHPGALAELSRKLTEAKIDLRGIHIVNNDDSAGIVALETTSPDEARELLKDILVN